MTSQCNPCNSPASITNPFYVDQEINSIDTSTCQLNVFFDSVLSTINKLNLNKNISLDINKFLGCLKIKQKYKLQVTKGEYWGYTSALAAHFTNLVTNYYNSQNLSDNERQYNIQQTLKYFQETVRIIQLVGTKIRAEKKLNIPILCSNTIQTYSGGYYVNTVSDDNCSKCSINVPLKIVSRKINKQNLYDYNISDLMKKLRDGYSIPCAISAKLQSYKDNRDSDNNSNEIILTIDSETQLEIGHVVSCIGFECEDNYIIFTFKDSFDYGTNIKRPGLFKIKVHRCVIKAPFIVGINFFLDSPLMFLHCEIDENQISKITDDINKILENPECCDDCPSGCDNRDPPGICCNGTWYDTPVAQGECPAEIVGVCCSGVNAPDGIWLPIPIPSGSGSCCNGNYYPPQTSGTCCNNTWYPIDPPFFNGGDCCGGVWHSAENPNDPCPEGQIFLKWGVDDACCGCLPEQVTDYNQDPPVLVNTIDVKEQLCCPGGILPVNDECPARCCTIQQNESNNSLECICQELTQTQCANIGGDFQGGSCDSGCNVSCCVENADGIVSCSKVKPSECTCAPSSCVTSVAPHNDGCYIDCADNNSCLGACFNPTTSTCTQTKQENCAAPNLWLGLGTACPNAPPFPQPDDCRSPFSTDCCESIVSKCAGLTITQPKHRRLTPFTTTLRATVIGTTKSPIRIHGVLIGSENEECNTYNINHSFTMCGDSFDIDPVPCDSNFRYLDIQVCWEADITPSETLEFASCNDIALNVGNNNHDCSTTLVHNTGSRTSSAQIITQNNATISAISSGPLILTGGINATKQGSTVELNSTGSSANEISGTISGSQVSVYKTGNGIWRLSGTNTFTGQLKVEQGTLIVGAGVGFSGPSPIGDVSGSSSMPLVGTSGSGANFFLDGVTMSRGGWTVASGTGTVAIGGVGTGTSTFSTGYTTRLGRDVTLQASSSGTVRFGNTWQDVSGGPNPEVAFNIGSTGNDGTVVLESDIPNSVTSLTLVTGTLKTDFNDRIPPTTPVAIQLGTYDRDGFDQSIDSLTVTQTATFTGNGTTTINNSLSGSGNIVNSAGTLQIDGTNTMTGSVSVTGGSVVVTGISGINTATFTNTNLIVDFSSTPSSGDQFVLLAGPITNTYNLGSITISGASVTASFNSSTSTLIIS